MPVGVPPLPLPVQLPRPRWRALLRSALPLAPWHCRHARARRPIAQASLSVAQTSAEAPVGDRRWRSPVAVAPGSATSPVFEAKSFGPNCMQSTEGGCAPCQHACATGVLCIPSILHAVCPRSWPASRHGRDPLVDRTSSNSARCHHRPAWATLGDKFSEDCARQGWHASPGARTHAAKAHTRTHAHTRTTPCQRLPF